MNIYVGNITDIDEGELNVTFTERFSNAMGCYRWPTRLYELCVVAKDILVVIVIIVTSFAPISSKIKLSGATKPGD